MHSDQSINSANRNIQKFWFRICVGVELRKQIQVLFGIKRIADAGPLKKMRVIIVINENEVSKDSMGLFYSLIHI